MPSYQTKFFRELFARVQEKVDKILITNNQKSLKENNITLIPSIITSTLNEYLNLHKPLSPDSLQQIVIYGLSKVQTKYVSRGAKFLIPFYMFVHDVSEKDAIESLTAYQEGNETINEDTKIINRLEPSRPEFPLGDPSFPASPHYKIYIPGFNKVWLKDESYNPCGTHKDRKALEIRNIIYNDFKQALNSQADKPPLPIVSIISSGNEAYSLQSLLAPKNFNLKVILDNRYKGQLIEQQLNAIGCKLYFHDTSKELNSDDVKKITENTEGRDFTSYNNEELIKKRNKFYDWLSYEILNLSPDYCFIPVGTGDLFLNILELNKAEIQNTNSKESNDPRFFGNVTKLKQCNFMGATTNNASSKADKLFTYHNKPTGTSFMSMISEYLNEGFSGPETGIYEFSEEYLDLACEYADATKIQCEPSGIAGLALFFQQLDKIPTDKKIVIVNTGKLKVQEIIDREEKKIEKVFEKVKKIKSKLK